MEEFFLKKCEEPIEESDYFCTGPPAKRPGRKRLLVFGTFDIIHPSHLKFLFEARKFTNCPECELVAVIARDSSIKKIKGRKPVFGEKDRLRLMCGLRLVDYARLGNEGDDYYNVILEVDPDYIVLGYDQIPNEQPLRDFIKEHNLNIKITRMPKFESGDLVSSSEVREKVMEMINEKNEAENESN